MSDIQGIYELSSEEIACVSGGILTGGGEFTLGVRFLSKVAAKVKGVVDTVKETIDDVKEVLQS